MAKAKRKRSEVLIDLVEGLKSKFAFFRTKETEAFEAIIKKNSAAIDTYTSTSFTEMVQKRQASKYYGMSEEAFKAQMKAEMEARMAIFKRAQTLTKEDMAEIEAIKEKSKASRDAAKKGEVEELLANI